MSDKVYHHCYWTAAGLGEETIKRVLKNSGLTEKEAEVYIFLARHDVRKGTEIARLLRKDKAQVFRILRRLQAKGFVEATLDFPTRFTIVPFENVIDSIVKAKQDEVAFIKETKKDLLDYLSKKRQATPLEKFVVIKGNKRIYAKISQIIKDTRKQLSLATTVTDLLRGDRFGVLDVAFNHPLRSQIQFRFLTEISEQNLNALKALLNNVPKSGFNLKARNPDLGLSLFPRMITRDNEEILFFTSPKTDRTGKNDVCLWTNCKTLVQTFTAVFEDLWLNSTDLPAKMAEIETRKPEVGDRVTEDVEVAEEKCEKALRAAEKDIVMLISAKNLTSFWESKPPLKEWAKRSVSVRIMAPITKDTFGVAENLSKFCEVRHVPASQVATTIVDGKHLFHFKIPSTSQEEEFVSSFKTSFYSEDFEYVENVKIMLDNLWRKARSPSPIILKSIIPPPPVRASVVSEKSPPDSSRTPYNKIVGPIEKTAGTVTEKEVLNKIANARRHPVKNPFKEKAVFYGKSAIAVIHPPEHLNLPEMIIQVVTLNDKSSFGPENWISIFLWLDSPKGKGFVPAARVQDRPVKLELRSATFVGSPAATNIQVIKKDEFQVQAHGNILFAGWTKPIPLLSGKYTLPPSCILFEGYGEVESGFLKMISPLGFGQKWEFNNSGAFVTFFHPSSKYSGPGTDGRLSRELVLTSFPSDDKSV